MAVQNLASCIDFSDKGASTRQPSTVCMNSKRYLCAQRRLMKFLNGVRAVVKLGRSKIARRVVVISHVFSAGFAGRTRDANALGSNGVYACQVCFACFGGWERSSELHALLLRCSCSPHFLLTTVIRASREYHRIVSTVARIRGRALRSSQ